MYEKMPTSLIIKDMQIKTTVKYHSHPLEILSSKRLQTTSIDKDVEKKPSQGLNCKLVQSLFKTTWKILKNLKLELSYAPAISLLGIYLEKAKSLMQKHTCTLISIAALFIIAKIWKQSKCPSKDE